MLDKKQLELKSKELIASLLREDQDLELMLDRLIGYQHRFTDQRKKAMDPHGLDVWANDGLGLEATTYTEEERRTLRDHFSHAEKLTLERTKTILQQILRTGKSSVVKALLSKPIKDEVKAHFCEVVAQEKLLGYEEEVITLYLKGTSRVSSAALDCMKTARHPKYYLPLNKLEPSRARVSAEERKSAIDQIRSAHPFIRTLESSESFPALDHALERKDEVESIAHVLIALPHASQRSTCRMLDAEHHLTFIAVGQKLEELCLSIESTKVGDYLNELKKHVLNSLGIGGWNLAKPVQKAIVRNMLLMGDYAQLQSLLGNMTMNYRMEYFRSVLNPPKHIREDSGKKRLLWVYGQIERNFREDFTPFEKHIRWHLGNEDKRIRTETLLLLSNGLTERDPRIEAELRNAGGDPECREYLERINSILSAESLEIEYSELRHFNKDAIDAKVSASIKRKLLPAIEKNLMTFCNFFSQEILQSDSATTVFDYIFSILAGIDEKDQPECERRVYESFREILSRAEGPGFAQKLHLILAKKEYVEFEINNFPELASEVPSGVIKDIISRAILDKSTAREAVLLSVELYCKDESLLEEIFGASVKRIIDENFSVADILTSSPLQYIRPFVSYLSTLKRKLSRSTAELQNVNETLRKVIVGDIVPKLEWAMKRAGGHEIFTAPYAKLIDSLREYSVLSADGRARDSASPQDQSSAGIADLPSSPAEFAERLKRASLVGQRTRDILLSDLVSENLLDVNWLVSEEVGRLPAPVLDWLHYKLLDLSVDDPSLQSRFIIQNSSASSMKRFCAALNQMLYRLYHELSRTKLEIENTRESLLNEVGGLIARHLERIEIGLFGYHELRQGLMKLGLEKIVPEAGAIVSISDFSAELHEVLPSEEASTQFQAISLGLKVRNGKVVRRAFLESVYEKHP